MVILLFTMCSLSHIQRRTCTHTFTHYSDWLAEFYDFSGNPKQHCNRSYLFLCSVYRKQLKFILHFGILKPHYMSRIMLYLPIDANRFSDEITFPLSSLFEKKVQKWTLDILLYDLGFSQFSFCWAMDFSTEWTVYLM